MEHVIRTHDLTKHFGDVEAVDALDLSVERGEIYGFLGLNGAGKTTTVRMLAGALPPTRGSVEVAGTDVVEAPEEVAHRVGVVFGENITPEPGFSPVRYLRYIGRLYGLDRETIDERARQLFDLLDLEAFAERPTGELSGGNKRKVEIARCLLHGPSVLLLDEPTRELDIPSKRSVWRFLQNLTADGNVTIFLSSHDVQEIATLCSRIGIIGEGVKTWEGRPAEMTDGGLDLVDALSQRLTGEATIDAAASGAPL